MTHHPHVHMIVPGGGIVPGGDRWVSSHPAFLLPVRVLVALFRRLFLTRRMALHDAGRLAFNGRMAHLAERRAFLRHLSPVRNKRWVVYAKAPFAGPEAVLAYLSRYTHRVAISNSRLIAFDTGSVTFGYKDYRRSGPDWQQVMIIAADEFIRRFLLHVLPRGFHRIRHYGLLAASSRKTSLDLARKLLAVAPPAEDDPSEEPADTRPLCPCCGGHMVVIETFERGHQPRGPPSPRRHPGPRRRDPARLRTIAPRAPCGSGNDRARLKAWRGQPNRPLARREGPCQRRKMASKPPVRIERVRAYRTFVRLTAPETLQDCGQAAFGGDATGADVRSPALCPLPCGQAAPNCRDRCSGQLPSSLKTNLPRYSDTCVAKAEGRVRSSQARLTMLYRSTDRLSRCGAPVEYLAHSASVQLTVNSAPSKPGIKHSA